MSDKGPEFQEFMRGTSEGRHPWMNQEPQPIGRVYPPPEAAEVAAARERAEALDQDYGWLGWDAAGMVVVAAAIIAVAVAAVVAFVGIVVLLP